MKGLYTLVLVSCGGSQEETPSVPPTVQITAPLEGEQLPSDTPFVLRGTAKDADTPDADLRATWLVDDETVCEGAPVNGGTTCEVTLDAGEHTLTLKVSDKKWSTSATRAITAGEDADSGA